MPNCGSTWNLWDLHVHTPTTRRNNRYADESGDLDARWSRFIEILTKSRTTCVGLTDYFTADSYYEFRERWAQQRSASTPQVRERMDSKTFFINIEFRLSEAVNKDGDPIDYHLLLPGTTTKQTVEDFLANIPITGNIDRAPYKPAPRPTCKTLLTSDLDKASVKFADLTKAINNSFGNGPDRQFATAVPNSSHGISPNRPRLEGVTLDILRKTDFILGNSRDSAFYQSAGSPIHMPVLAFSDAHSFSSLEAHDKVVPHIQKHGVTWVKGRPTIQGLLQAVIEPSTRLAIQEEAPDRKSDFYVIDHIAFPQSQRRHFPETIPLNPNMNVIIGSRSSGKSTLLRHIAHAIDATSVDDSGPAAGISWPPANELPTLYWRDGHERESAHCVLVSQNELNTISGNAEKSNSLISDYVSFSSPEGSQVLESCREYANEMQIQISNGVSKWYEIDRSVKDLQSELAQLGSLSDHEARLSTALKAMIEEGEESDAATLSKALENLPKLQAIRADMEDMSARSDLVDYANPGQTPEFTLREPIPMELKAPLKEFSTALNSEIARRWPEICKFAKQVQTERSAQFSALVNIVDIEIADVERIQASSKSSGAIRQEVENTRATIARIEQLEHLIEVKNEDKGAIIASLSDVREKVLQHQLQAQKTFEDLGLGTSDVSMHLEFGLDSASAPQLVARLDKRRMTSQNFVHDGDVDLGEVWEDLDRFLSELPKVTKKGVQPTAAATEILSTLPFGRLWATMEGDRIGGFRTSTMTPGKQSLFALKLILTRTDDKWPLLLDQPEDDLDSRSIYSTLRPFLQDVRRNRQVVVVTHDANIAVACDAEEIIVANRQGDDAPNPELRTFDYLVGALEDRDKREDSSRYLERLCLQEHACEILDGGREAFRRRTEKYALTEE